MDALVDFLVNWGYLGMFLSAILAGSVMPFCSELVLMGLIAADLDPVYLIVAATAGNVLGAMVNYFLGRLGNEQWIYRWAHVKPERLAQTRDRVQRHGVWAGLLGWVPFIGSVITVAMGLLRVNAFLSALTLTIGKAARYVVLAWAIELF